MLFKDLSLSLSFSGFFFVVLPKLDAMVLSESVSADNDSKSININKEISHKTTENKNNEKNILFFLNYYGIHSMHLISGYG